MLQVFEVQDLFCDAYVTDQNQRLIFISLIGRDTAIQQLLASFSLPLQSGGLDRISFRSSSDVILIGDHARLEKHSGRLPKSIFGVLNQTWIFDPICQRPDHANKTAWLLDFVEPAKASVMPGQSPLWPTIKMLSALPLLDHWESALVKQIAHVESNVTAVGVTTIKVSLDPDYEAIVSELVKTGVLVVPASPHPSVSGQLELV
jgi:hypothetical protein